MIAGLVALTLLDVWLTDATGPAVVVGVAGALFVVAFVSRTSRPAVAPALLAGAFTVSWLLTGEFPLAPTVAAVGLLAPVARRLTPPASLGLGAMITVGAAAVAFARVGPFGAFVVAFLCLVVFGVGLYLRGADWRRREEAVAARREERLAIAGELHDVVGHHLTGIVVQAQAAQHVATQDPTAAAGALARIEREGTDALAAMRRMVGAWRDGVPTAPAAGWDDVRDVVRRSADRGVPVTLRLDPGAEAAAPDVVASVHRIVTEALTNVARHAAGATVVSVEIDRIDGRLDVSIVDDGPGAQTPVTNGHGLVGMRVRVETLGGAFEAGPGRAGGWCVHAALPVERRR